MAGSSAVLGVKLEPMDVSDGTAAVVAALVGEAISWQQLKTEYSADQTTRDLVKLLTEGAPKERNNWPVHLQEFHRWREAMTVTGLW